MKNKGISLIVLIITIVVILIFATAILVNIGKTSVINIANEAVVKQDFVTMQDELDLYIMDKFVETSGKFDPEQLNADEDVVEYTGVGTVEEKNIKEILPSIKDNKYKIIILNGKIVIDDSIDQQIKEWASEALGSSDTKKSYTVTLDPNGASGQAEQKSVIEGISYKLPQTNFVKDGYKFVGWCKTKDGKSDVYSVGTSIAVTDNMTIYAIWALDNEVIVTFNPGDGATGNMNVQVIEKGIPTKLLPNQYTKEGYRFIGWFDEADNIYSNEQEVTLTEDVILTAHWEEKAVPNYGTKIESSYDVIYKIDSEGIKTPIDTYYSGYWKGNILGKNLFKELAVNEKRLNTPTNSSATNLTQVKAGTNVINFINSVSDNWIGMIFSWGSMSGTRSFGGVKLLFDNGQSYTIQEAVNNGYIEPLVIYYSREDNSNAYVLQNPEIQLNGGTESREYSNFRCMLKVKDVSPIKGVQFDTNADWNYSVYYDGFEAYAINNGTEFSIE